MFAHRFVFVLSFLMMVGSLYVSTFGDPIANLYLWDLRNVHKGITPCMMCRYIRMSSYPLVLISWLNLRYHDIKHTYLLKAFAWLTLGFCLYKYYLELSWMNSVVCTWEVSCSEPGIIYAGFITLSLLGIVTALAILCVLYFQDFKQNKKISK